MHHDIVVDVRSVAKIIGIELTDNGTLTSYLHRRGAPPYCLQVLAVAIADDAENSGRVRRMDDRLHRIEISDLEPMPNDFDCPADSVFEVFGRMVAVFVDVIEPKMKIAE